MTSDNLKLSIILPTYNEEFAVATTVKAILALDLPDFEIIVVDDGSTDKTATVAREAGARVISHPYNIGNGAAVKTGIRSARGEILVFLDSDGQHDPQDIPKIIKQLDRYHMVIGARSKGSESHWHRNLANKIYNRLSSFIADFEIQDLTSGFRAIRRSDALRFCDMFPNRFSYPTTSTLAFLRSGRSILYLPITTRYRIGTSKIRLISDGFEFLVIITKIAVAFSPLRIFLPISSFLFFLGLFRYFYTYTTEGRFTNMSHLLITTSVVILMLGLVSEQIAALRLERGDKLFEPEDSGRYSWLKDLAE